MIPSGIRFNDFLFTEPVCLSAWEPPKYAGLFVILASDTNWAPKPYQPLYFGEFGNNTPESLPPVEYSRVLGKEKGRKLFVAVLPMPFTTTHQRCTLRSELIRAYNPTAQAHESQAAIGELAGQFQYVEKPRQRIGFLP
jgi:hypothetical protein